MSLGLGIVDCRNQHEARYEKLWMWCEEVIASQKALKKDPLAPEEKRSDHSDHSDLFQLPLTFLQGLMVMLSHQIEKRLDISCGVGSSQKKFY